MPASYRPSKTFTTRPKVLFCSMAVLESGSELLSRFDKIFLLRKLSFIWAATRENQRSGFRQGLTQTELYCHRRWLEAWNFGFRKKRDCTIYVAKTKALISFAWFSHDAAHIFVERIMSDAMEDNKGSVSIDGRVFINPCFVDDCC